LYAESNRSHQRESNITIKKPDRKVENVQLHWKGDLDGMLKRHRIRVLVVANEIMYHLDRGKKSGFVYEYMKSFERYINRKYPQGKKHIKTRIIFIPVSRDRLIPDLLEGRGDIAVADIAVSPEKQKSIDFTAPFLEHIQTIVVSGKQAPAIHTVEDLSGREILVRASSGFREYLEALNETLEKRGLKPVVIRKAPEQLEDEDLMEMANAGLIDYALTYRYKAELWSELLPNIRLHPDIVIHNNSEIAWMLRKKSPKLLEEANAFIKKNQPGSRLSNILLERYLHKDRVLKTATTGEDPEQFREMIGHFEKYAEQYDLNDRLMVAQGYQESRLRQNARSRVGAVGVMQLMPATGRDMKCGDINVLENNIHAGIKYHRWIIDHFFNDPSIDAFNKTMFTFAAYNAGVGRIDTLRKLAKKRGYNPNEWFGNVEYIAAEKIGAETVTYVSNIFKYYVAYTLYKEHQRERISAKEAMRSRQKYGRSK
jgi:membrane-bound lytic murein transglycosylase MltF